MLTLALLLFLPQRLGRATLQPYEVHSPSGAWALEVKPSDPHGKGPMRARILHDGQASWSGEFAWTFEAAGVSDDGTCVGYANGDALRIAVLDSKGESRKQHEIEHTASVMHGADLPNASGPVLVHATADLALIRVHPADQSRLAPWRAFRLSTGEAAPDVLPEEPLQLATHQSVYEGDARAIGETQLTLAHWWFADYDPSNLDWPQEGGVFALHDLQGKAVWTLALLDDYTDRASEEHDDRLAAEVRRAGVIVSVGPGNRFVLLHVREKARVEYSVERDERSLGGWLVKELSRAPWDVAEPTGDAPAVEPIELRRKATIALGASRPKHPVHDVIALGFTERGELELMRREWGNGVSSSYALLRPDGELVFERDLTPHLTNQSGFWDFHELSGDRWLIQFSNGEPAWLALDVRTGDASDVPLPVGGLGCHVAPLADGGYLALVQQVVRSLAFTELYRVGADGTLVWKHTVTGMGPDDTAFDRAVYFGNGIARTGETTFAVLGSRELTRIDLDRNVLQSWQLEDVLGRGAGYMNGFLSDAKGGVLFREGDAFQQIDAYGTKTGSFVPKRSDGSRDASMDNLLRVAPDGRLWTSDRQRVYRLDEAGVVDLVLGPESKEDELIDADQASIDVLGRALVQDRTSRAVHVFDSDGRRLAICRLAPDERPERYVAEPFHGNLGGGVSVRTRQGLAQFDATGERIPAPGAAEKRTRRARETASDAERRALRAIKTRPDGKWFAAVEERVTLPDGRRLVLESPTEQAETASIHFYSDANEPLRTVALPRENEGSQISVGERWIAVGGHGPGWTLLRIADEKLFHFEPGLGDPGNWHLGQAPDGKTLLLLNAGRLELVQYELP